MPLLEPRLALAHRHWLRPFSGRGIEEPQPVRGNGECVLLAGSTGSVTVAGSRAITRVSSPSRCTVPYMCRSPERYSIRSTVNGTLILCSPGTTSSGSRCSGRNPTRWPSRGTRFIGGEPRNVATNVSAGSSYTSTGRATAASAALHHRNPVAEAHRLRLVVRHIDRRGADRCWNRLSSSRALARSLASRLDSGSSSRKTCGFADQRSGQRDPLAFTAGELPRAAVEQVIDAEQLGGPASLAFPLCPIELDGLERKDDVVENRLVRVERVALEHHGDAAQPRRQAVDDLPSMSTSPSVGCSRPAMVRSSVVLPQPDGPSRTRYSPSRVARSMPSIALTAVSAVEVS